MFAICTALQTLIEMPCGFYVAPLMLMFWQYHVSVTDVL